MNEILKKVHNTIITKSCESGGIGRRARFRIWWPKGLGGSSPPSRTTKNRGIRNTSAKWNNTKEKLPSGPQITQIHADASRTVLICVNLRNLWASPSSCFKRLKCYVFLTRYFSPDRRQVGRDRISDCRFRIADFQETLICEKSAFRNPQ